MSKYANGIYQMINPEKYVGKKSPHFRSSWEQVVMRMCDNNPSILQWANESIHIPYRNPFTNKNTIYVPDFFVVYQDANGTNHAEIWEIKPLKETSLQEAGRSKHAQAHAILNACKWAAARAYCAGNNIRFRILTEHDIFAQGKR
jgi:hypothetical protein